MNHPINPFLQHAMRHGRMFMDESGRAADLAQSMMSSCDEIISSINSGNMHVAMSTAQNCRNMASEMSYITQDLNNIISERLQMASYVVSRIQHRINELAGALETMRGYGAGYTFQGFHPEPWQHTSTAYHWQTTPPIM